MREYGISFDESGLPVGSYALHRRDGASLPTAFGSFAKGVALPVKGRDAMRLCIAMGQELSHVERIDEATGLATLVWSLDGTPPHPKTLEEELASLPEETQAQVRAALADMAETLLDASGPVSREDCLDASSYFRERQLPALATAFHALSEKRATKAEIAERIERVREAFGVAGDSVPDDPTAPRLVPNENDPIVSAESTVDTGDGPSLDEVLAGAPEGTLPATPEPIAPVRDKPKGGKKKG